MLATHDSDLRSISVSARASASSMIVSKVMNAAQEEPVIGEFASVYGVGDYAAARVQSGTLRCTLPSQFGSCSVSND